MTVTDNTAPPHYTTNITVDQRGFVRVDGLCVGRRITEDDQIFFEVKDRRTAKSTARGTSFIRVPLDVFIEGLT